MNTFCYSYLLTVPNGKGGWENLLIFESWNLERLNQGFTRRYQPGQHRGGRFVKYATRFIRQPRNQAGLTSLQMNMEVLDERLFDIVCPGKARTEGREEWIKRLFEAVNIFGKSGGLSTFVVLEPIFQN